MLISIEEASHDPSRATRRDASGGQDTDPRMGGVLKAAMIGEPPSLDLHVQGFEPGPYMHFWNVWLDKR
jgi:hypothetical protein